jgi:hypothetical protein
MIYLDEVQVEEKVVARFLSADELNNPIIITEEVILPSAEVKPGLQGGLLPNPIVTGGDVSGLLN